MKEKMFLLRKGEGNSKHENNKDVSGKRTNEKQVKLDYRSARNRGKSRAEGGSVNREGSRVSGVE